MAFGLTGDAGNGPAFSNTNKNNNSADNNLDSIFDSIDWKTDKTEADFENNYDKSAYLNYASEVAEMTHNYDMEMAQWNAQQSKAEREWSEYMSNTSYQRAVADLKAAGLNPVLASKLTGASTPTATSARGSSNAGNTLSSVFNQLLNSAVSTQNKLTDFAIASMYVNSSNRNTDVMANASMYGSDLNFQSTVYRAEVDKYINSLNNTEKRILADKQMDQDYQIWSESKSLQQWMKRVDVNMNIYNTEVDVMKDELSRAYTEYVEKTYPKSIVSIITQKARGIIDSVWNEVGVDSAVDVGLVLDNVMRTFMLDGLKNPIFLGF